VIDGEREETCRREEASYVTGTVIEVNGKVCGWGLYSTEALWLIVLLTPKEFLHSSLKALHAKRRERPQLAKEGTIDGI
jgi:hypothetical protein